MLRWYLHHYTNGLPEPPAVGTKAEQSAEEYISTTSAFVLFPTAALRLLERMRQLSNGRLLLLSSDKGYSCPDSFRGIGDPHIAIHKSFSVMVNFHAIRLWATLVRGFSLHTRQVHSSEPKPKPCHALATDEVAHSVLHGSCGCVCAHAGIIKLEGVQRRH